MDYCDDRACGIAVAAKVIVCLPSGGVLTYCQHHANEYQAKLEDGGAVLFQIAGGAETVPVEDEDAD